MNQSRGVVLVLCCCVLVAICFVLGSVVYEIISNEDMSHISIEKAVAMYNSSEKLDMTVTLTTVPQRLSSGTIRGTLISLLVQNPAANDIVLNIPYVMKRKNIAYEVPLWLKGCPVRVRRCDDSGPATKYLPTLNEFHESDPDRIIFVMDDDVLVPVPNSIQLIYNYAQTYPDKVVTGHSYFLKGKGTKEPHFNPMSTFIEPKQTIFGKLSRQSQVVPSNTKYIPCDIVLGYQGYVLRAGMVDLAALQDYHSMPPEAFFVDDVVISANLASCDIERVVVSEWPKLRMGSSMTSSYIRSLFIQKTSDETLATTVNMGEHNNRVMTKFFWYHW